jgi:ABC-type multidrug transport system fused ATPase/permease subunit
MLFFNEGFTFRNFLVDAITIFVFVVTFWLLITVFMDLFRRHDISGWGKAFWVIGLLIFPLLAVLVYLITQGRGMAERNTQQAQQARDELRRVVGFSAADEIEKLDRLKKAGSITDAEFARLRAKLVQ